MSKILSLLRSPFIAIAGFLFFLGTIGYYLTKLGIGMNSKYLLLALGGILLVVLLVVGIYYLYRFIQQRRGKKMEDELAQQEATAKKQQKQQAKIAVTDIRNRWSDALATLKSSKVNIYDLPWLLLIGEPQSGKTTTLRESGLDFPLGKDALSGSGGTVNCDWWFTNEAVILDTAGRFTMPVDSAPDREEWHAFLRLLSKYRPRCPINGVVVTIPSTSLLEDSNETIRSKARNIQEKLHELVKVLGIEFPVYIMVSKLDLVYGFAEFCSSLSSDERIQAMGWNRRDVSSKGFNADEYNSFFDRFVSRLHSWSLRRLRDIPSGSEADRVYAFSGEFNRVKDTLGEYLNFIFSQDRFHTPLLLRGCYFSSGLQEGRSIAKALLSSAKKTDQGIMAEFAKSFVQSRAYFINVFYRKVFREQGLVSRAGKYSSKELGLKIAAGAIATVFLIWSSWVLFSGYNRLIQVVRPIEVHVKKAQSILLGSGYGSSPEHINEVLSVVYSLETGRQNLMQEGAKRFLKGRENITVKKLGRIEDALLEQKIFYPVLLAAGDNFSQIDALSTPTQKKRFLKLLQLYIDTKAGRAITGKTIEDILEFVPWDSARLNGISRDIVAPLAAHYPYGDMPNSSAGSFQGTFFHTRDGLGRIQEFWKTYYVWLWKNISQHLSTINTSYASLASMHLTPGDTDAYKRFHREASQFNKAIEFLSSIEQEQLVWNQFRREKCFGDYFLLQKSLSEQSLGDIATLTSTTTRHSKICQELDQSIGVQWRAAIQRNNHIIKNDGKLDPDMLEAQKIIKSVLSFGPLFKPEHKNKLRSESGNPVAVVDFWDAAWKKESDTELKNIEGKLSLIKTPQWQKEEFPLVLRGYFNHIVWMAERDATIAAMEAVGSRDAIKAKNLQPGFDPPRMAQANWLRSRYIIMISLLDNLKERFPSATIGLNPVRETMGEIMLDTWQDCLNFWNNTLRKVNPGEKILATNSWPVFRREAIDQGGIFLDPAMWPLDAFFDSMSLKDIQQLKEILWQTVDKSFASSKLRSLERKVEKTAYVYSGSKYLDKLEQAQNDFYMCMKRLNDDAVSSWNVLSKNTSAEGRLLIEDFKAFSNLQNRIERDAASRGELLAKRLIAVEEHGMMLLRKKVAAGFQKAWLQFLADWSPQFKNTFPFGSPEKWMTSDTINANIRTINFKTGSPSELHDFFFSSKRGFEPFTKRYGLLESQSKENSVIHFLSENQKKFIKNCQKWRIFLFDDKGRPKKHQMNVKLDEGNKLATQRAASRFTQVLFSGLEDEKKKTLRLRFSGSRYKMGNIVWDLQSASFVNIEAKNEETGMTSSLHLTGGSLSFPAYMMSFGHKEEKTRLAGWNTELQFPESLFADRNRLDAGTIYRNQSGFTTVPLIIGTDETMPDSIAWPRK